MVGKQPVEELVGIGLGSNLGDRAAALSQACRELSTGLSDFRVSAVYESVPVGLTNQPDYLNACIVGRTGLSPIDLLAALQAIERSSGRSSGGPRNGPRVLDIDLLLYGQHVVDEARLAVPHPRLRNRAFVLVPLAEVASDWLVPASAQAPASTVGQLAEAVDSSGVVRTDIQLVVG